MSNDKEIIKKLLAIATKQQKIITKLAQTTPQGGNPPPPPPKPVEGDKAQQHLQPNPIRKENVSVALREKLPANIKGIVNTVALNRENVGYGAQFKIVWDSNQAQVNEQSVNNALLDAAEALQKEGFLGMPSGKFYAERQKKPSQQPA